MPAVERIADRLERMAVANDVAEYIGVDRGMVLDSFRKAVDRRQDAPIERPRETIRPDERGLVNILLSDVAGRHQLIGELDSVGILDRIATRRILLAVKAAYAAGSEITFDSVSARLEPPDQNLLAELALAEDADRQDLSLDYGKQCVDSLRRSGELDRKADLKRRIKEAERAGNVSEALRLAAELQQPGRAGEAGG